jgi:hypothetical protein
VETCRSVSDETQFYNIFTPDYRHRADHGDVRTKSGHPGTLQKVGTQSRQNPQEPDHVRLLTRARRQRHQRPLLTGVRDSKPYYFVTPVK